MTYAQILAFLLDIQKKNPHSLDKPFTIYTEDSSTAEEHIREVRTAIFVDGKIRLEDWDF